MPLKSFVDMLATVKVTFSKHFCFNGGTEWRLNRSQKTAIKRGNIYLNFIRSSTYLICTSKISCYLHSWPILTRSWGNFRITITFTCHCCFKGKSYLFNVPKTGIKILSKHTAETLKRSMNKHNWLAFFTRRMTCVGATISIVNNNKKPMRQYNDSLC